MNTNDSGAKPNESTVSLEGMLSSTGHTGIPFTGDISSTDTGSTEEGNTSTAPVTPPVPPVTPPTEGVPPTNPPVEAVSLESYDSILAALNNPEHSSKAQEVLKDVFDIFKATAIDKDGNLVDANAVVVLSADKLKAFIDTDTLPLDDKGNMVNDKGEILKSKDTILEENSVVLEIKKSIETNFGIEFPDLGELPETGEGIIKLVETAIKLKNTSSVKNFLDNVPELKGFYQHLLLGGKPENYTTSNIDYKNINVKTLEESAKLDLLNKAFTSQGTPNKEKMIALLQKAGEEELNEAVIGAINYLDTKQKELNSTRELQLAEKARIEQENTERYWKEVDTTIKNGKIGVLNIPVTEREAFFKYMSEPVNDNYDSADSLAAAKDSLDFELMVSYLRFKKGDIGQLVKNLASQQKVETLRERMAKHKELTGQGVPSTGSNFSGKNNGTTLSLEGLLK